MVKKRLIVLLLLVVPSWLYCTDITLQPKADPEFYRCLKEEIKQLVGLYAKQQYNGHSDLMSTFGLSGMPGIPRDVFLVKMEIFNFPIAAYVLALVYIDRLAENVPGIVTEMTFFKIFSTALVIAAKVLDDDFDNFATLALRAGIRRNALQMAERAFLFCINFELGVSPEVFDAKIEKIISSGVSVTGA